MHHANICRAAAAAIFSCALAAPVSGQATRMTASEKGSLLVYSNVEIRWDASGNVVQDTILTLVNDLPQDVRVQLYFVNGDPPLEQTPIERQHPGWNRVDSLVLLTASQPSYWSAFTGGPGPSAMSLPPFTILDPSADPLMQGRPADDGTSDRVLRGFIYAWAVDALGNEIAWDHLTGGGTIYDYRAGAAWAYRAWSSQAAAAIADGLPLLPPFGRLDLNNQEYVAPPGQLVFTFEAAVSSGPGATFLTDTDLTLHPLSADLRQTTTGPTTTKAAFLVWNENEIQFSGLQRCISCWDSTLMSLYTSGGAPNHFLAGNLQTDYGRARVDGVASQNCLESDCCAANGTPGCDDLGCQAAICLVDPFCCTTQWDLACANQANDICGVCPRNAALLGLQARQFVAGPFGEQVKAAASLTGIGSENAVVQVDTLGLPETPASPPAPVGDPVTQDRISAEEKGSLLIFPRVELRWDAAGNLVRDTVLSVQNDSIQPVRLHVVYVNGDPPLPSAGTPGQPGFERAHLGWNQLTAIRTLTASQPTYWSAATGAPGPSSENAYPPFTWLDPDVSGVAPGRPAGDGSGDRVLRGFAYAWAVDDQDREISFNHLAGSATVVDGFDVSAIMYTAYASQTITITTPGAQPGTPGTINLDGTEFAAPFDLLLLDFFASGSQAFSGGSPFSTIESDDELTLHAVSLNEFGPVPLTKANVIVWNEDETQFTGMYKCVECWDQALLSVWPVPPVNHFLLGNLQTNMGKARIDGLQSVLCDPGNAAHALLGVQARQYVQNGGQARAASGTPLTGLGEEAATVTYNPDPETPEACCLLDGTCAMLSPVECTSFLNGLGGIPQGFGSTCATADCPQCGDPAAGTCAFAKPTPYCFQSACCQAVCAIDPYCCSISWDTLCADEAAQYCTLCPGDTNDDGVVNVDDLVNIIVFWGTSGIGENPPGTPVLADVAGPLPGDPPDGIVDVNDLNAVIVNWGPCP